MNINSQNTRIKYIDTAKCIGIILIVMCHMLRNGIVFTQLMPMSVPLFFFLSGITFKYKGLRTYFRKKIPSLMIPYFFCGSISILMYSLLGSFAGKKLGVSSVSTSVLPNLAGMLYANSKNGYMKWNNSLWFIPCLFCTGILACMVEFLIQKKNNGSASTHSYPTNEFSGKNSIIRQLVTSDDLFRIISIIVCLLVGRLINIFYPEILLPWHFETALDVFIFFEAGFIAGKYTKKEAPENKAFPEFVSGAALIASGIFIFSFGINGTYSMRTDEYTSFLLFAITAFIEISGMLLISRSIHSNAVTDYCGRNTLPVLLWNKFPVLLFQTLIPCMDILKTPDTPQAVLISIIPALLTVILCLICGHIQALIIPWSLGKSRQ